MSRIKYLIKIIITVEFAQYIQCANLCWKCHLYLQFVEGVTKLRKFLQIDVLAIICCITKSFCARLIFYISFNLITNNLIKSKIN